jgi:hypothetical protein
MPPDMLKKTTRLLLIKLLPVLLVAGGIVAFSAVLDSKPDWSDSFLNKKRIAEVAPVLEALL